MKATEVNGVELEPGQYGEITEFLNDKVQSSKLIQFIGIDSDGFLKFQYDPTGDYRLTMNKNCFPIHTWKSDPMIERKTIIVMHLKK